MNRQALEIANQLTQLIQQENIELDQTAPFKSTEFKEKLLDLLRCHKISDQIYDYKVIKYLEENGIFFHFDEYEKDDKIYYTSYIGEITQQSELFPNYVCEIHSKSFNGNDFLGDHPHKSFPTITSYVNNYKHKDYPRAIINKTGISEMFKLVLSNYELVKEKAEEHLKNPKDSDKLVYAELVSFIGEQNDEEVLTNKYIALVINENFPWFNKMTTTLAVFRSWRFSL